MDLRNLRAASACAFSQADLLGVCWWEGLLNASNRLWSRLAPLSEWRVIRQESVNAARPGRTYRLEPGFEGHPRSKSQDSPCPMDRPMVAGFINHVDRGGCRTLRSMERHHDKP